MPEDEVKLSSAGSVSASADAVLTSSPSRSAFPASVASIPGEISVAVARSIAPACSRLREK